MELKKLEMENTRFFDLETLLVEHVLFALQKSSDDRVF